MHNNYLWCEPDSTTLAKNIFPKLSVFLSIQPALYALAGYLWSDENPEHAVLGLLVGLIAMTFGFVAIIAGDKWRKSLQNQSCPNNTRFKWYCCLATYIMQIATIFFLSVTISYHLISSLHL